MTSQPGSQTVAIHILPYVSRSKCNQQSEIWSVNKRKHEKQFS